MECDYAAARALGGEADEVRSKLIQTAISGALTAFAALQDGLAALEHDVTRDPPPVWSPLVLTRAIAESIIMTCYLIDPDIDTDTRIARIAGALVTDDDNASAFERSFNSGAPSNREWTINEMRRGGILIEGTPRRYRVTAGSVTINADYVITEEAKRLLPLDSPEPYRLFSAPGHARPWGLERTAMRTGAGFAGETATLGAAFFVVAYALGRWVKAWAGYFGLDAYGVLSRIEDMCREFGKTALEMYPPATQ